MFTGTPSNVTISGYNASDTMRSSASTFASGDALLGHTSRQGAATVSETEATHSVMLSHMALSSLIRSRFAFA